MGDCYSVPLERAQRTAASESAMPRLPIANGSRSQPFVKKTKEIPLAGSPQANCPPAPA
jgi:hypothetical protein